MGILVRKTLTIGKGITVPSQSLILLEVTIAIPVLYRERQNPALLESEENPVVLKHRRIIRYTTRTYESVSNWKDSNGAQLIFTNEIPAGWAKEITEEEYALLISNAAYAEVWFAECMDEILGGDYCDVINALEEEQ